MKIGEIWNSNLFWFIFSVLLIAFAVNDKFTGHWGWNSWTVWFSILSVYLFTVTGFGGRGYNKNYALTYNFIPHSALAE